MASDDIALDLGPVPQEAVVEAEEDALHQLFLNLLVNAQHALRASPKPRRIGVSVTASVGAVEVVVADNGPGVPAAIRGRIFEPYFTTKQQGEGTGIGLSVCHAIVAAHGGMIAVDDRPGGGARFTMTEKIGGPLFPLFARYIPPFDESFEQFAADLKREAEAVQAKLK